MSENKKKHKPSVRIRRAEFAGQDDKFYAPSDDIRNCYLPIVRGGLEAAAACHPDYNDELCKCSQILAEYYQDAFLVEKPVVDLMHEVNLKLQAIDSDVVSICMLHICLSMMTYYGVAQRETSAFPDLTKPQIEKIAGLGTLLSKVRDQDRLEIIDTLVRNRVYADELDRPVQEGIILNENTPGKA